MNHLMEVLNLSLEIDSKIILRDISFSLDKGMVYGIFGASGAGKTALIRCVLNIEKYRYGEVLIEGRMARNMSPIKLAKLISYVPQEIEYIFPLTVGQAVLMGRNPHLGGSFAPGVNDRKIAFEAMDSLGIVHLSGKFLNQVSAVERRLALIARAIAQSTPIIAIDSLTSFLDFENQIFLWKIVKALGRQGKTLLVSSCDTIESALHCDEALVLKNGMVYAEGTPSNIFDDLGKE